MEQCLYGVLKMVKVLLKILIIILFFILLSSEVYAINLGSVAKNKFAEISSDESVKFKMLFWNVENESYTMKLSVKEAPKDWVIIIDPNEFILNKSIGEEYISLPYIRESIKAKVVNLFVKPDSNSKPGKYFVMIETEVKIFKNETTDITIVPRSIFKFEIDLKDFDTANSNNVIENKENRIDFFGNGFEYKSENLKISNSKNENQIDKRYFYFIILFMIVLISITIYKKY